MYCCDICIYQMRQRVHLLDRVPARLSKSKRVGEPDSILGRLHRILDAIGQAAVIIVSKIFFAAIIVIIQ